MAPSESPVRTSQHGREATRRIAHMRFALPLGAVILVSLLSGYEEPT